MIGKRNWVVSILALVLPMAVGVSAGFVTSNWNPDKYYINKPLFVPPSWIFPVVWTVLYVMMGIALYLIVNADTDRQNKKVAVFLFLLQLVFNFLWPVFFFRYGMCYAALLDVCILWFLLFLNVVVFYRIHKTAGLLLIPYLLWVGFAIYLNMGSCFLN